MYNKRNDADRNVQKSGMQKVIEELHAKLEWYTKEATDEEFDPKAVESILYLLDIYEPVEEQFASAEDAWTRFEKKLAERNLINDAQVVESEAKGDACEVQEKQKGADVIAFVKRQKVVVAAVLVILLLALVGTTQAEAIKQKGFFFWLRQDDTGRQMITSPESLDSTLENDVSKKYYDWDDVPEWCIELSPVDETWKINDLEWQYVDVVMVDNYKVIKNYYTSLETSNKVLVGVVVYNKIVSINTEVFGNYDYIGHYSGENGLIHVYSREDKSEKIYFRLCRFVDNKLYFVDGDDFEMMKILIEEI